MKRFLKSARGFTLMEIAIVMVVLGFVFVPLIAILVQDEIYNQGVEEEQSSSYVKSAVNFFLKQNGRYPCPALLDRAPGAATADYGLEDCVNTALSGGVRIGALPVTDLGLPFDAAITPHGWKYIYAVTDNLRDAATFDAVGAVTVLDRASNPSSGIHYIIVDPGEDGKGAVNMDGSPAPFDPTCVSVALDAENCDGDAVFLATSEKSGATDPTDIAYYDDRLFFDHVDEKADFWIVKTNQAGAVAGAVEITNRGMGNIGFGTATPAEKVDVVGNLILQQSSGGGNVDVIGDIVVGDTLLANTVTVDGGNAVTSQSFCSGWSYDGGSRCCNQQVYNQWNGAEFAEVCGIACSNGEFRDALGNCCSDRGDLDPITQTCP